MAVMCAISCALYAVPNAPGMGTTSFYATDAFPGFDKDEALSVHKKTPRWFSWINGPAKDTAEEQLAFADSAKANESWRTARRAYDALVREWPASPEAPIAQERLAAIYLEHYQDYEEAFFQYRYLLDYFSSQCDYQAVIGKLYEIAKTMEREGKRFLLMRFANTVDVRRAYEGVVVRSPGAQFAPEAMLTIAKLREDDMDWQEAIQVYETLRNLHPNVKEAKIALYREAATRMRLLRDHAYNRSRTMDTISFLKMALTSNPDTDVKKLLEGYLNEATKQMEEEAFKSAKFYDSRTRTKQSAVNAYERFLRDYPASPHVKEVRERLDQLKNSK